MDKEKGQPGLDEKSASMQGIAKNDVAVAIYRLRDSFEHWAKRVLAALENQDF